MLPRVRFAPSPTGWLHVGGARTALFNWLYARRHGGTFVLRIEDTDEARNTEEAMRAILSGLKWLGIDWDEGPEKEGGRGPYFQSRRKDLYLRYVRRLLDEKKAYEEKGAIRFRLPRRVMSVPDLICGMVHIDLSAEPDLTLVRADGSFIFHLVNVVDDLEMGITHVIRGEDHLSNTPKHLALYEAFAAKPPAFAHIPLILNKDGTKMSKRDAGAALGEYMAKGYAPDAVRNYLCLLGWSPKDNREVMTLEELVARFDLAQVNRSNARFDLDKLEWMNTRHMMDMPLPRFLELARPHLGEEGAKDPAYADRVLAAVKDKVKHLADLPAQTLYFFRDDFPIEPEAMAKALRKPGAADRLAELRARYATTAEWNAAALEAELKALAAAKGAKPAEFIHPCRAATSGRTIGPSLYPMLEALGRERVLARLDRARSMT
ncbi:MAG: glutamate--tRNA ligase [Verrucomicrobiae bacterium]|nr:glutamate--tRNA ligase [Verrucomicrobiae bacterium]